MEDLEAQKTKLEIEKLQAEIREIKRPFWKNTNFISSFYLPIIILSGTYFLNRDYISQSLELKSVQQQLAQVRLDTLSDKIKKDSQFIAQEEYLQKLRLQSINSSLNKIKEDSILLNNKKIDLLNTQNALAIQQKDIHAEQNDLHIKTLGLKKRDSLWQIDKRNIENSQRILNDSIQSAENRLRKDSVELSLLTGNLNIAKLISMFTEVIKPKINRIAENLLFNKANSERFLKDSIYADSLFDDLNRSLKHAEDYSITIGKPLNGNITYVAYKNVFTDIQHIIMQVNRSSSKKVKGSKESAQYAQTIARLLFKSSELFDSLIAEIKKG